MNGVVGDPQDVEANGVGDKIRDGLHLELGYDIEHNSNSYLMEFRFIPVGAELEAFIGLIEDPELRATLRNFVYQKTQIVYTKQYIDRQILEDVMPQLVPMIIRDFNERQLDAMMDHLREIFKPKVEAFLNEKDH